MESNNERFFEPVSRFSGKEDEVIIPRRSTKYSAGYDFFAVEDVSIPPTFIIVDGNIVASKPKIVKTGVKAHMNRDNILYLFSRSSGPMKRGLVMANSVGCIDSDYYDADGEIGFMFYNFSPATVLIKKGDKIGQGIFMEYLKVVDDNPESLADRVGGFGSTGNN